MAAYDLNGNIIASGADIINNWSLSPDQVRRPIKLETLGTLPYNQAFCIYNDQIYNTNGSRIAVLDMDFNTLSDTAITLGHGNNLQLGSNGHAYASGWNTQKVYDVNLSDLSVTEISLPTSGYTTCVVDDVKGLIYIFNRLTPATTETYYDFIIYDYINQSIISTRKLNIPFGGMQSADLLDDHIIVLAGLGSDAVPNKYMVFDRSGNLVSVIMIGSKATEEPEGVFIDRSDNRLYMSFYTSSTTQVTTMYEVVFA